MQERLYGLQSLKYLLTDSTENAADSWFKRGTKLTSLFPLKFASSQSRILLKNVIFTAKTWKQPKCPPTDKWIKKMWYIHTNRILLSHKKEWNNAICSNMDGPRDDHAEWSKSDRETQTLHIIYVWNLKNSTNEPIYKTDRLTDVANKVMVSKGKRRSRDKLGVWD